MSAATASVSAAPCAGPRRTPPRVPGLGGRRPAGACHVGGQVNPGDEDPYRDPEGALRGDGADRRTRSTAPVSHEGSFTLRYRDGPLKLAPVALNLRDGDAHSGVNHADVKDCYLFAPIDVQPGTSPNKVPIGHGERAVAVLATATMAPTA